MKNLLVQAFGWRATILHGDPTVSDRWQWLKKHLQVGKHRTLDAGCGSGAFTMYAALMGNEAIGISFDKNNMARATERSRNLQLSNISFVEGDLRKLDAFSPSLGQFDQVICLECIEHILDDEKLICDLVGLLRPEGMLLLTTPNLAYKPLAGENPAQLSIKEDGGHVRWGYTHERMAELFSRAGLEIVSQEYVSGYVSQKLTNVLRILDRHIDHRLAWAITFPLRLLKWFDRPVTRWFQYPPLSIGVVGKKRPKTSMGNNNDLSHHSS